MAKIEDTQAQQTGDETMEAVSKILVVQNHVEYLMSRVFRAPADAIYIDSFHEQFRGLLVKLSQGKPVGKWQLCLGCGESNLLLSVDTGSAVNRGENFYCNRCGQKLGAEVSKGEYQCPRHGTLRVFSSAELDEARETRNSAKADLNGARGEAPKRFRRAVQARNLVSLFALGKGMRIEDFLSEDESRRLVEGDVGERMMNRLIVEAQNKLVRKYEEDNEISLPRPLLKSGGKRTEQPDQPKGEESGQSDQPEDEGPELPEFFKAISVATETEEGEEERPMTALGVALLEALEEFRDAS